MAETKQKVKNRELLKGVELNSLSKYILFWSQFNILFYDTEFVQIGAKNVAIKNRIPTSKLDGYFMPT